MLFKNVEMRLISTRSVTRKKNLLRIYIFDKKQEGKEENQILTTW